MSRYDVAPASPRRPLRVGVQLPEVEREVRWPELLDMARLAESIGLDSLWVGDHLLYRYADGSRRGPWEAWSLLAALAAVTSRIRLGPLVACTAFHNPAVLAKQADTLDELSGGRFVLGIGAGWNETEFRAFGIPFDQRISRFEEAFTIIRTLLRDGVVDFAGRFHAARDAELVPRGPTPGGPPIMLGSSGARMLAIGIPHADAWNAWYADTGNQPGGHAPLRERVDAACIAAGREPAAVARTVAVLVRFPGGSGRIMGDTSPSMQVPPLAGAPPEIAEGLRDYHGRGSARSSWCWTRSPGTRSRPSSPCSASSTADEPGPEPPARASRYERRVDAPTPRASIAPPMPRSSRRHRILAVLALSGGLFVTACTSGAPPSVAPTPVPTPVITPDPHLDAPASVDDIFRLLQVAGLRITPNTASGGAGEEPVKRINATYASWPLKLTQFSTPTALASVGRFDPAQPPRGSEAPYIVAGMNVLIEFGPELRREPGAANDEAKREAFGALVEALDPLVGPLAQRSVKPVPLPEGTAPPAAAGVAP